MLHCMLCFRAAMMLMTSFAVLPSEGTSSCGARCSILACNNSCNVSAYLLGIFSGSKRSPL